MTETLTPRQRQILDWIRLQIQETGRPPTRAELAQAFGFRSINAAVDHLKALARHGVIELQPGSARGIRLLGEAECIGDEPVRQPFSEDLQTDPPEPWQNSAIAQQSKPSIDPGLPIIGRVAAGEPILASEHIEDYQPLDPALFHPRADYLLRVQGESMRDSGIHDGDLLAVHRTPAAENGQIVVARFDEEVTVKRLKRDPSQSHRLWLLSENPDFSPILVDLREQTLDIEGVGVGILRVGLAVR